MGRPHILVLPFPIQGHISPLLQLSQLLAESYGCLVTFVNTEYNQKAYEQAGGGGGGVGSPHIRMLGLSDGLPLNAPRKSSEDIAKVMQSLPRHMKTHLEQLLSHLNSSPTPVSCIIADIFMPWVHSIPSLPRLIGFHVSSVAQFAAIYRLPHLISSGQLSPHDGSVQDAKLDRVSVVPELLSFEAANIPWCSGNPQEDVHLFRFLTVVQKHVPFFDAMLFNSFTELEGQLVGALVEESKMKMLTVGPLLLSDEVSARAPPKSGGHEKECWEWLEGKAAGSVLYISFGTTAWLSREEMQALALGVEAAGVPFMWVLRSDLVMGEAGAASLPTGFVERTKERAFFTPWAPQTLVLSHPSLGAFITHGGWNSAIEAICMGVPMLTWPYGVDQKGNCQLIVENWEIGLPLRVRGKLLAKEEVEKIVTCLVKDGAEEGERIRQKVASVRDQARSAFAKGGSSYNNLHHVMQLIDSSSQQKSQVHAVSNSAILTWTSQGNKEARRLA